MADQEFRETTVEEIVRFLEARQYEKHPPTLFLGHRAGGLCGNAYLYEIVKQFSLLNFDSLSNIEKFKNCHAVLHDFSEEDKHPILMRALKSLKDRKEEEILAALAKERLFDTIITTNIDTLFEDACVLQGMKQPDDYNVIIRGDGSGTTYQKETHYQVIKVFGDWSYYRYKTAGNEFDLEADQKFKEFLCAKLSEEVLIIGYDPVWDQPIEQAFIEAGKMLRYVGEELPPPDSHLVRVLNQRGGEYLVGPQGNYRAFLTSLHGLMKGSTGRKATIVLPSLMPSYVSIRDKAFVSYSHEDTEYLERLQVHVKGYWHVYGAEEILECWDDTKIGLGMDWRREIKNALASAKVAVLLVSADFLASKFIYEHEIPTLLEAAMAKEVEILSVVLGPCPFDLTRLSDYQTINGPSKPLMSMGRYEREKIWADAAKWIWEKLNA